MLKIKFCNLIIIVFSFSFTKQFVINAQQQQKHVDDEKCLNYLDALNQTVHFSTDLFGEIVARSANENILVSPFMSYLSMAVLYTGSAGITSQILQHALNLRHPNSTEISLNFHQILSSLSNASELRMKNILYLGQGPIIRSTFVTNAHEHFHSHIKVIKVEDAKKIINATNSFSVNELYFHGKWHKQFPTQNTNLMPFYSACNGKSSFSVPMMQTYASIYYRYDTNLKSQIINLPYTKNTSGTSMMVVLPDECKNVTELMALLKKIRFETYLNGFQATILNLSLPKFTIQSKLNLTSSLESIGLTNLFSDCANFSNITIDSQFDIPSKIQLTDAVQNVCLVVNEEGEEEMAATDITEQIDIDSDDSMTAITFNANHPFIFLIYSMNPMGIQKTADVEPPILFMGIYLGY